MVKKTLRASAANKNQTKTQIQPTELQYFNI